MSDLLSVFNSFSFNHPWVPLVLSIYLVMVRAVVGVRDAIDKTPLIDDNWFERFASLLGKTLGYMAGIRPKAPPVVKDVAGPVADAAGVPVAEIPAVKKL